MQGFTNRKLHKGFRLLQKSLTLNDLERRNGHYLAFFPQNLVAFGANYVKVVEDTPKQSAIKM